MSSLPPFASRRRRAIRRITPRSAVVMTLLLLLVGAAVVPALAQSQNEGRVTICHATNSFQNPYRMVTVNHSSVDGVGANDHTHHSGDVFDPEVHTQQARGWGDIIPPVEGVTDGLNWDEGEDIWDNGCRIPDRVVPTVLLAFDKTWTGAERGDAAASLAVTDGQDDLVATLAEGDEPVDISTYKGETLTFDESVADVPTGCTASRTSINMASLDVPDDLEVDTTYTVRVTNNVTCPTNGGGGNGPETGDLLVTKAVVGDDAPDDALFDFTVVCDDDETDAAFPLGHDGEELFADLDAGTECTVTEVVEVEEDFSTTVDGESGTQTTVEIVEDEEIEVAFVNTFPDVIDTVIPSPDGGSLLVAKAVVGDDAPANAEFDFTVVCGEDPAEAFPLTADEDAEFDGLADGTRCVVTETDDGGADRTLVDGADGATTTVAIEEGEQTEVLFVNVFGDVEDEVLAEVIEQRPTTTAGEVAVLGETITRPSGVPAGSGGLAATGIPAVVLALMGLGAALAGAGTLTTVRRRH